MDRSFCQTHNSMIQLQNIVNWQMITFCFYFILLSAPTIVKSGLQCKIQTFAAFKIQRSTVGGLISNLNKEGSILQTEETYPKLHYGFQHRRGQLCQRLR